jgi:hypothetical protein
MVKPVRLVKPDWLVKLATRVKIETTCYKPLFSLRTMTVKIRNF